MSVLLAIDVGNTNTVFGLFQKDRQVHSWRCKTESSRSADEYAVFLNQLFELEKIEWHMIQDVIMSSVVPETETHLDRFCKKYISRTPFCVDYDSAHVEVDLEQPGEIGADRLVNARAVMTHYPLPAVVVDFGTATTFDVIDERRVYRGGVIAPGIRLSMTALVDKAAKLPHVDVRKPKATIGKNTRAAMQSGLYWGYLGMIEKIIDNIAQELGTRPHVIATGGLAPLYAQDTKRIDTVDDSLIFKGLLEIYRQHKKAEAQR